MRIVSVAARTVRWPIAGDGAARGRSERAAVLVEVRSDRGAIGLGEAAPLPGLSIDTLGDAQRAITAIAARVPFEIGDRNAALAVARAAAPAAPAARFAIETALLDALARDRGSSLAALLRAPAGSDAQRASAALQDRSTASAERVDHPRSGNAAVSGSLPGHAARDGSSPNIDRVPAASSGAHVGAAPGVPLAAVVDDPASARRAFDAGIRCLKIKVDATEDFARVFLIAGAAPKARLRIDANRSWPRADVAPRMAALVQLPIDYVEEPCAEAHLLAAESLPCKIALDESLATIALDDLRAALRGPSLAALVLKPTLLGGLSAVMELAALAREAGVAAIVSHGLEGPIGTAACAELALAIGGDHAVGLAAHPALAGWRLTVPQLAADRVQPAASSGLGFVDLDLSSACGRLGGSTEALDAG